MAKRKHKRERPGSPQPDMNVTPLVDIVLVLLIIFMVVTPALAQGEQIEIPEVAQIDKRAKDMDPIKLVIAANGRMLLNERVVNREQLKEKLTKLHQHNPNRQLKTNIDSKIGYKTVREMLALFQDIGFKGVSLKVRPKKKAGG